MPCPCLCLPPSRRLRPPAASLLLRASLRKRRRLPNLSFQRRTNDARHNSRLNRAQRNALLPPFGDFSSQSGAVLRSEACTSGKRCPSCSPCPEKRLSAAAETVFGRIAFPPDSGKKPRTAPGNGLCGLLPNSPTASILTNAPGTEGTRSVRACTASACLHDFYIPLGFCVLTRLLRSDSASASRLGFCIPTRLLHPGTTSPFQNSVPIPQHRSSAALRPSPTRRLRSDSLPLRRR